jgi:hypothetical protein
VEGVREKPNHMTARKPGFLKIIQYSLICSHQCPGKGTLYSALNAKFTGLIFTVKKSGLWEICGSGIVFCNVLMLAVARV